MRAMAGTPVVFSPAPMAALVGHVASLPSDTQARERRAYRSASGSLGIELASVQGQLLSSEQRRQAWRTCADVRAAVDTHVRGISTWDWYVEPAVETDDPDYETAMDLAKQVYNFLAAPNENSQTWQDLSSLAVRDLLLDDALAIEKVSNARGQLVELVAIPGGTIVPEVTARGNLMGYRQEVPDGGKFKPQDLVYMNLFPCTGTVGGNPLMDTLVLEIMTLIRSSEHLMHALSSDEIPPGIVMLGGLARDAAKRATEDIRNSKGSDHKLHVISSENPTGLEAKWIEFRRTPKDLDLKNVVHEVRRVVWRVFGVKPVSMGDTEATPRATADVQVTSEDSDMTRPILELLSARINMDVIPAIIGDESLALLVRFGFEDGTQDSAADIKLRQEGMAIEFDHGVLTLNEWRAEQGRSSYGPAGDMPLLRQGNTYVPLDQLVNDSGDSVDSADTKDGGAADGSGDGADTTTADGADPTTKAIAALRSRRGQREPTPIVYGKVKGRLLYSLLGPACRQVVRRTQVRDTHVCGPTCTHGARHVGAGVRSVLLSSRAKDGLPSDWQPGGRFKDHRTLDLVELGGQIIEYRRRVSPSYMDARNKIASEFSSALAQGSLTTTRQVALMSAVNAHLEALAAHWSMSTEDLYIENAKLADKAVEKFSGMKPSTSADLYGSRAHGEAMGFLVDEKGLITTLRADLQALMLQLASRPTGRSEADDTAVEGATAAAMIVDSNEYRIDNWGGRLVLYANQRAEEGLRENATVAGEDGGTPTDTEWMVEWCAVGDKNMCATCEREGNLGFRPLSALPTVPGGGTECRGRCRCVLVFWTREEVKGGTAISLSNAEK